MVGLDRIDLFDGCTKADLAEIERLTTMLSLPAGRELTAEGMVGREVLVLVEGTAGVFRRGEWIGTAGPGDVIGEIALLGGPEHRLRTATVTADTDVVVLVMSAREFRSLLTAVPCFATRVHEVGMRRLAALAGDEAGRSGT